MAGSFNGNDTNYCGDVCLFKAIELEKNCEIGACYDSFVINDDGKHSGELGDLKDTKYWFRRDIGTIKAAIYKTKNVFPILLIISSVLSLGINYWSNSLSITQFLVTTVSLIPISLLGYFLFFIMANKGYDIHADGRGTVLNNSRDNDPKQNLPTRL